jgi:hypothetical protein
LKQTVLEQALLHYQATAATIEKEHEIRILEQHQAELLLQQQQAELAFKQQQEDEKRQQEAIIIQQQRAKAQMKQMMEEAKHREEAVRHDNDLHNIIDVLFIILSSKSHFFFVVLCFCAHVCMYSYKLIIVHYLLHTMSHLLSVSMKSSLNKRVLVSYNSNNLNQQ